MMYTTICCGVYANDAPVTVVGVTKVLETVRKYLNVRASPSECGENRTPPRY
jgi:hypothetical protein